MGIRSRQKFSNIAQALLIITDRKYELWIMNTFEKEWYLYLVLFFSSVFIVIDFLAALAALYLHMGLTEWLTVWSIQRDRRGNAHILSDKLQLPSTTKMEVI